MADDDALIPTPLDAALFYAAMGWRVAPVQPGSKVPSVREWQKVATTDVEQIRRWWHDDPTMAGLEEHGVCIVTGPESGLWVLDVDVAGGKPGLETLKALVAEHGDGKLPETLVARTPSGGYHYFFAWPEGREIRNSASNRLGPGLDVRGEGGQVNAAPTTRGDACYRWADGREPFGSADLQPAPAWLVDLVADDELEAVERMPAPSRQALDEMLAPAPAWVGEFNARHTWAELLAGDGWIEAQTDRDGVTHWVRPGKDRREGTSATTNYAGTDLLYVYSTSIPWLPSDRAYDRYGFMVHRHYGGSFQAAADALKPPSPERVDPSSLVPQTAKVADPVTGEIVEVKTRRVVTTPAAAFTVRPVHWLWRDRMPTGELTLLAGREGVGKSTIAYTLAAWITRGTMKGRYFGTPRGVIVAATEDSWEHTIVPRLMAAGADLERVHRAEVETLEIGRTPVLFPIDLLELERVIVELEVALVIVDPLTSRLGDRDTHKDAEVRQGLEPLVATLHRTGAAGLGLIHLNKSSGADTLTSVMGSRAFVAVARSVLFAIKDPEDDTLRRFGLEKNNLGRSDLPVYLYRIVGHHVTDTDDGPVWTGRLDFEGEVDESISATLAAVVSGESPTAADEAADWLAQYFEQNGPKAATIILAAGKLAEHSEKSLRRGLEIIGGESKREGKGAYVWWPAKTQAFPQALPQALPNVVQETYE
jgi:hypothetical protein